MSTNEQKALAEQIVNKDDSESKKALEKALLLHSRLFSVIDAIATDRHTQQLVLFPTSIHPAVADKRMAARDHGIVYKDDAVTVFFDYTDHHVWPGRWLWFIYIYADETSAIYNLIKETIDDRRETA